MKSLRLLLLSILPAAWARDISLAEHRDYSAHDYYVLHLDPLVDPESIANFFGVDLDGRWPLADDHYVYRTTKSDHDVIDGFKQRRKLKRSDLPDPLDYVLFDQKQVARRRLYKRGIIPRNPDYAKTTVEATAYRSEVANKLGITDPIFNDQWHLFNVQNPGNDMNVGPVWMQGITGKNVTVCIIDDGLDGESLDLKPNYSAEGSYDFNDKDPTPKPRLWDDTHGTRCAGEVAAAKNDVCGVGVAYESKISGVRILSAPITDLDEAEAVAYKMQVNDIYSCSWGPPDDGATMDAPGVLIRRAMQKAVQEGRGGLGSVYVFAVGNGALHGDNCNFDGYTNSIFSVSIGAVDKNRDHPYYSEACSAQLGVTYSSGGGDSIHTTDVGVNKCTKEHGGTSAAGPLVAGIYALLLSSRPDLSWRDVQWLTVLSSKPFYKGEKETSWQVTASGQQFSHQFGYGIVDAGAMIELAKDWKPVSKQAWYYSPWVHVKHDIPEGDVGVSSTLEITKEHLAAANFAKVEQVTVTMNVEHTRRGDLSVELRSPFGVVSHLSVVRNKDNEAVGYLDWTFMSVAHFGETGIGNWEVIVKDHIKNEKIGKFIDYRIKLYGESIDPSKQEPLPLPVDGEDADHDVETTTGIVSTTTLTTASLPTAATVTTEVPTRPAIQKPTDSVPTSTNLPSETSTPNLNDSFLPSPFPTFGASRITQIWVYGAIVIIGLFCIGLAAFFYIQKRKYKGLSTDDYEFAVLDDQETDAMLETKGRRKRAGELYDAFAGESDEELFSDDETRENPHRTYRDSEDDERG
jgi:kexin